MFFRKLRSTHKFTDEELVQKYKASEDNHLVGELFKRYTHLVFGVCMKYLKDQEESKDAVMQIFEKLLEDLKKHEVSNFKSWLHSVTRNHCLMELRRRKPMQETSEDDDSPNFIMESAEEVHLRVEKEEELQRLELAIQDLKEEQRICVDLFFIQEKSYQEVCDATGFDMNQVKSYIQNGKRNLKISLENSHAK